jgi:hypothetical protein
MAENRQNPDSVAGRAVIEQLREESHLLRGLLVLRGLLAEAYFKIAILEETSKDPSQPSEQPGISDSRRH